MTRPIPDWIVLEQDTLASRCLRCGDRLSSLGLPIGISAFLRYARAFAEQHAGCHETKGVV